MYLGINRFVILVAVMLVFTEYTSCQQGNSILYRHESAVQNSSVVFTDRSIIINYSVSDLYFENMSLPEGKFYRVTIPGHIPTSGTGKPEIPVLSRLISIPEGYSYRIKITNVKSSIVKPDRNSAEGLLFPVQEGETKSLQQSERRFIKDKESYSSRGILKTDTVAIIPVGKIRENNLANLIITPVRYNPMRNNLEVIWSMKVEIIFQGPINMGAKSAPVGSGPFEQLLGKGILNYNQYDLITGYSEKPVRMIVLTDTSFKKQLAPFLKWKTQKGFRLDLLYKGAAFAGNDYISLKNSIKSIYDSSTEENPPPEYLLIVGDVNRIPFYGTGQVTDMYYGEFTGNGDYMPEMFVGRLPVADTNELKNVLKKIIQYEKFEFADTNKFYANALAITGDDASYANYLNGQVKYAVSNYLKPSGNIKGYPVYYPYPNPKPPFMAARKDSVIGLINKGTSFINYSGHGLANIWLHLNISVSDTAILKNKNMYPFIISNACQTSRYNTSSLGNAMVKAKNKGAVGFIGCSNDSYWDEDFYWAVGLGTPSADPKYETTGLGAFDRLFHTYGEKASDWYITMGQVIYAGNLAVSASTSSRKKYYWETYNLVGDPSVIPIIGTPGTFSLSLPDTLPNNLKSLSLISEPFSYVAISHFDTLWDASYTSPSGSVTLNLPGLSNDSCLIVVTGQNRRPLIKTIYFSEISSPYINLTKTVIDDESGNDNGLADFGETINLDLTISNLGLSDGTNVRVLMKSLSGWVTAGTDSVYIGSLPGKSEVFLNDGLSFSVSRNVPDKGIVTMELIVKDDNTTKRYLIDITIHAPLLSILSCRMDDSATGNSDHVADPGESVNLVFQVLNNGSSNTSGQFTISTEQTEITILEPSIKSGTLGFGEITEIVIPIKISEDAVSGSTIFINSLIDCAPFIDKKEFSFRVGRVRESFESGSFKVFPWINISAIPWKISGTGSFEGGFSAQSGVIPHNSSTSLIIRTKYETADSLRFFYKVSSELNYDFFSFKLNNTEVFKKSGETSWIRRAVAVPAGYNKMEWIYKKDQSVSSGSDRTMIDMIDFSGSSSVSYIKRDIETTRLLSPFQKEDLNMEEIIVKVLNTGADTVKGFYMAYSINNNAPVKEFFNKTLIPYGDTTTVSFSTKANMWYFGNYNIRVYNLDNNDDYLLNDTLKILINNKDSLRINVHEPVVIESYILYPNPVNDKVHLKINAQTGGKVRAVLTNTNGRKVSDTSLILTPGENIIELDVSRLAPAIYFMSVESLDFRKTIPVVKTNQ